MTIKYQKKVLNVFIYAYLVEILIDPVFEQVKIIILKCF